MDKLTEFIMSLEDRLVCTNNRLSYLVEMELQDLDIYHDEEKFISSWDDWDLFEKRQAIQNLVWEAEDRLRFCKPLLEKLEELYYKVEDQGMTLEEADKAI